jgi:hypothetical protein
VRRPLLAAVVACVAVALVIPTGALPTGLGAPGDHVSEDVTVYPGTDTAYAYVGADGEVVVDLGAGNPYVEGEGVNADGRTHLSEVLVVRYEGDRHAHVWLTHDAPAVTFTARGRPVGSPGGGVTLEPNESVAVGLVVDTRNATPPRVDDLRIHARLADPVDGGDGDDSGGGDSDGGGNDQNDGWDAGDDPPRSTSTPTPLTPSGTPTPGPDEGNPTGDVDADENGTATPSAAVAPSDGPTTGTPDGDEAGDGGSGETDGGINWVDLHVGVLGDTAVLWWWPAAFLVALGVVLWSGYRIAE